MSVAELTRSGSYTEQLYLMTLVGAQLRDFLPPPATIQGTLAVHHSLVVSCCLLATFYPANGVLFVWGSWAMEMGSGAYNVYALFPSKGERYLVVFLRLRCSVCASAYRSTAGLFCSHVVGLRIRNGCIKCNSTGLDGLDVPIQRSTSSLAARVR